MKRNLLRITLVTCLIITSLLSGGVAYAQDEELPDPGITPDSPFYFFDKLGKNIGMFFTFGAEAKAKKALQYAEERLSEAQAMAEKNRVKEMEKAASGYDKFMAMVTERLEKVTAHEASDNISERLAEKAYRIYNRLSELKSKLPPEVTDNVSPVDEEDLEEAESDAEHARETIDRAENITIDCQIKALRHLAKNKPERALDISSDVIEKCMERARFSVSRNATADNVTGIVRETLDYADRIAALEDEMTAIAEEKGIDITAIQQHLAHSTTNRLDVLSGIYEKAPESARPAIENAIENSVKKYERAVEKLREKNAPQEITANVTALHKLPESVKEKMKIKISNKAQITSNTSDNITAQIKVRTGNQEQTRERLTNTDNENPKIVSVNQTREREETEKQEKNHQSSP